MLIDPPSVLVEPISALFVTRRPCTSIEVPIYRAEGPALGGAALRVLKGAAEVGRNHPGFQRGAALNAKGEHMNETRTRRKPTSAQARADLAKLFEVTPRMRAWANFESAKGEYDAATLALMAGEPGCETRADRALKMLNDARAELRRLDAAQS